LKSYYQSTPTLVLGVILGELSTDFVT